MSFHAFNMFSQSEQFEKRWGGRRVQPANLLVTPLLGIFGFIKVHTMAHLLFNIPTYGPEIILINMNHAVNIVCYLVGPSLVDLSHPLV